MVWSLFQPHPGRARHGELGAAAPPDEGEATPLGPEGAEPAGLLPGSAAVAAGPATDSHRDTMQC